MLNILIGMTAHHLTFIMFYLTFFIKKQQLIYIMSSPQKLKWPFRMRVVLWITLMTSPHAITYQMRGDLFSRQHLSLKQTVLSIFFPPRNRTAESMEHHLFSLRPFLVCLPINALFSYHMAPPP